MVPCFKEVNNAGIFHDANKNAVSNLIFEHDTVIIIARVHKKSRFLTAVA